MNRITLITPIFFQSTAIGTSADETLVFCNSKNRIHQIFLSVLSLASAEVGFNTIMKPNLKLKLRTSLVITLQAKQLEQSFSGKTGKVLVMYLLIYQHITVVIESAVRCY